MRHFVTVMLCIVGVIHVLPLPGVLGAERLAALYGISVADPSLEILMRHRAVLFGLLGLFLIYAAFRPSLQPLAFLAGGVSVVSFLWLAGSVEGYNHAIGRIVTADVIAAACLALGAAVFAYSSRKHAGRG